MGGSFPRPLGEQVGRPRVAFSQAGPIGQDADDPFGPGKWDVSGSGKGDTVYCPLDMIPSLLQWPFKITEFRQR